MEELIKNTLEEYFSDFKEYHLIILILFTIIIAVLQIVQSILISKKIEKFKNELKKSEIKFSKYNQLQIEALSETYPMLADLQINTVILESGLIKKDKSPEEISQLIKIGETHLMKYFTIFHKRNTSLLKVLILNIQI